MKRNEMLRQRIVELRLNNPCLTLQGIGNDVSVSRERVRQILAREGLPTAAYKPKQRYYCMYCGKIIENKNKCFCNMECHKAYSLIPLTCGSCGEVFYRTISQLWSSMYRHNTNGTSQVAYFCSKKCNGVWTGKNYGFKKGHDINARLGKRKYDADLILSSHYLGWSRHEIAIELGIPSSTVDMYVRRGN